MTDLLIKREAVISPDGVYRLLLERDLNRSGRTASIGMVNPSIADHKIDDHTIRKWLGFADRLDIGRFLVWNKFAFRAKDIIDLRKAADPIGPLNDTYIEMALGQADLHIVAWGPLGKLPPTLRNRWREVVAIADRVNCKLMCLGVAQDGHPLHPLTLRYDRKLEEWRRPDGR